eukprot:scaffold264962_cov16-Tisochrysis_lutea.AAC.1
MQADVLHEQAVVPSVDSGESEQSFPEKVEIPGEIPELSYPRDRSQRFTNELIPSSEGKVSLQNSMTGQHPLSKCRQNEWSDKPLLLLLLQGYLYFERIACIFRVACMTMSIGVLFLKCPMPRWAGTSFSTGAFLWAAKCYLPKRYGPGTCAVSVTRERGVQCSLSN